MARYRNNLPQLAGELFLTDGGLETTLIFHEGWELPDFAAFPLLNDPQGYQALDHYYQLYVALAQKYEVGMILESPTWRANADWGTKLGYSTAALADVNRKAIELLDHLRQTAETEQSKLVISGCIGPRGDGYIPTHRMSAAEATDYHLAQIRTFSETNADLVTGITINYVEEAIGITQAARSVRMPVVISFTVETDGNLPTGQSLQDAIRSVDQATSSAPAYYMINCAHPTHFEPILQEGEPWLARIGGLRANASAKSHAELNESTAIDMGDPEELGRQHRPLLQKLKQVTVLGGCCGTDHRHVEQIYKACFVA